MEGGKVDVTFNDLGTMGNREKKEVFFRDVVITLVRSKEIWSFVHHGGFDEFILNHDSGEYIGYRKIVFISCDV